MLFILGHVTFASLCIQHRMFLGIFRLEPHLAHAGGSHGSDVDLVGVFISGFTSVVDNRRWQEVELDVGMRNAGFCPNETARLQMRRGTPSLNNQALERMDWHITFAHAQPTALSQYWSYSSSASFILHNWTHSKYLQNVLALTITDFSFSHLQVSTVADTTRSRFLN